MLDGVTLIVYFIVTLAVWFWQRERSSFVRQIDRIPGPPKVPFFGNVFAVPRDGIGNTFAVSPFVLLRPYNWGNNECENSL